METVISSMTDGITGLTTVFTSLFKSATDLIMENWLLLAMIGIPLVGGVMFAVISWFQKK